MVIISLLSRNKNVYQFIFINYYYKKMNNYKYNNKIITRLRNEKNICLTHLDTKYYKLSSV